MSQLIEFPVQEGLKLKEAVKLVTPGTADIALVELTKLVDQGCEDAFSYIGHLYETGGRNVQKDYAKALFYYEQAVERTGVVAAYLGLIRLFLYGLGVEQDVSRVVQYCELLIDEADHPYAYFYMGKIYSEGLLGGKNILKAKEYFRKSWEREYVFGLTYLGIAEQQSGNKLKGWSYRLRAGFETLTILLTSGSNDGRITYL